jgi:hypothetical protein
MLKRAVTLKDLIGTIAGLTERQVREGERERKYEREDERKRKRKENRHLSLVLTFWNCESIFEVKMK